MTLFELAAVPFTLHSGGKSRFKINCDALTEDDWKTLAYMAAFLVGPFSSVEGIPRGGLLFAKELEQYQVKDGPFSHLIVDDVWTTGGSMKQAIADYRGRTGKVTVKAAVVFTRGPYPDWLFPVFNLHPFLSSNLSRE